MKYSFTHFKPWYLEVCGQIDTVEETVPMWERWNQSQAPFGHCSKKKFLPLPEGQPSNSNPYLVTFMVELTWS